MPAIDSQAIAIDTPFDSQVDRTLLIEVLLTSAAQDFL